tara:strand:+ start:89 stop:559 length:471 start_codon:yes stop_codon:yes gene_type:complete
MIIICPSCKKKFEIDDALIPDKGRLLKCGSCNETWFFNKNKQSDLDEFKEIFDTENIVKDESLKQKNKIIKENLTNLPKNKGTEIVKYNPKSNFTFGKAFNYLIVSIMTFVAVIIILDTFKEPLSTFFPNLELILYNLFETLRDLALFAKDLIKND